MRNALIRPLFSDVQSAACHTDRPYQTEAIRAAVAYLLGERVITSHFGMVVLPTGAGKTHVGNGAVTRLVAAGKRVLWLANSWKLLRQAAGSLCSALESAHGHIARIGGAARAVELGELPEDRGHRVVYSTMQTFLRRLDDGQFRNGGFDAVVIDEVHWAEFARSGQKVQRWARARGIRVLGLTATPRSDRTRFAVLYEASHAELVRQGYLARPVIGLRRKTGIHWSPEIRNGEYAERSIDLLAQSAERNRVIVETIVQHRTTFGRTLVFACNINHAEELHRRLSRAGIPCGVVHSEQSDVDNGKVIEMFRRRRTSGAGCIDVLINVAQLTHGVDIPEINTVMICRPTKSDILLRQMIGRGSRIDAEQGKTSFNVVCFDDDIASAAADVRPINVERYVEELAGDAPTEPRAGRPRAPGAVHHYDRVGALFYFPQTPEADPRLHHMVFRRRQTFGVEIELTHPDYFGRPRMTGADWTRRATLLEEALVNALGRERVARVRGRGARGSEQGYARWQVVEDASAGWEVKSPVLRDDDGVLELVRGLDAIAKCAAEHDFRVNHRTGLHLNLGFLDDDFAMVHRLLLLTRELEPMLATLVAPSRIAAFRSEGTYDITRPNCYCAPLCSVYGRARLARMASFADLNAIHRGERRYTTLNLCNVERDGGFAEGRIEVRMHNGTVEARKVLLWLSLWMQLTHFCVDSYQPGLDAIGEDAAVIRPNGCIVHWAMANLPIRNDERLREHFCNRLEERRDEVVRLWAQHENLRPWFEGIPAEVRVRALGADAGGTASEAGPAAAPNRAIGSRPRNRLRERTALSAPAGSRNR